MCDKILCFYFVRTQKPMVIGEDILDSQIWPVVSAEDDEKFNTKNHTKVTCATYFWLNILILLNPAD